MNWNFNINIINVPTGTLVAAIYDPTAPTVVVQLVSLPGPYTAGMNLDGTFIGINAQVYNFKLWDSPDGGADGTLKNKFSFQPTVQTTIIRSPLFLKAGSSIGFDVNTNFYAPDTPNDMTGWAYTVEDIGQGTLYPVEKIQYNTNGFQRTDGIVWALGEEVAIFFQPQVASVPVANQSAKVITGIVVLTAATNNLDNTYAGNLISLQGAGLTMVNNLPALNTLQEGDVLTLCSDGGSHYNAVFNCQGSDTIVFRVYSTESTSRTQIILGQSEQVQLIKLTVGGVSAFRVMPGAADGILRAGRIVMNYGKSEMNVLPLMGQQGLLRANYPRLWDAITKMDTQARVAQSIWANTNLVEGKIFYPNKGKFNNGDGSTTFGLPDATTAGFFRAINGTSVYPGDLAYDSMLDHQHNTSVGTVDTYGNGPLISGAKYGGPFNTVTDLTSRAGAIISGVWTIFNARVGTETKPVNHGAYFGIYY